MARCDLHVHSYFSGKTNHVKLLEPMDSYNTPERIYRTAKRRGMDYVTITDHDAIGGCLDFMRRHPGCSDFFMSEEVSTRVPEFGYTLHVGVYRLTADDHAAIQPLRRDWAALLEWLDARGLFYTWNHPFYHFPTGSAGIRLLELLLPRFPAYEGINACLPPRVNDAFADGCRARAAGGAAPLVAGSDSHSMWRVAHTWTEAPGDTLDAFFAALRTGRGNVHGNTGSFVGVFADAMSVYLGYLRDIAVRNDATATGPPGRRSATPSVGRAGCRCSPWARSPIRSCSSTGSSDGCRRTGPFGTDWRRRRRPGRPHRRRRKRERRPGGRVAAAGEIMLANFRRLL